MTLRDILLKFQPEDDENLDSPDGGGSGGGVVDPTIIPPPVIPKAVRPAPRAPVPPPATNAPIMAPDGNHPGVLGHLRDILNNAPGGRFNDQTTIGPDGQPQTVRTPTTTGSVMSAIGNLVRPAIAGAAHVNTAGGGPKDWFEAAAAGAQANQAHADKQKKLADDARAKQIEDFEIQRQTGTDARLQGAADEKAKHDEATAA